MKAQVVFWRCNLIGRIRIIRGDQEVGSVMVHGTEYTDQEASEAYRLCDQINRNAENMVAA